jgi:phosphate starvation-inducible membrane PsiE
MKTIKEGEMASFVLILAAILEIIRGLACFFSSDALAKILGLEYIPSTLVFAYPLGAALFMLAVMFLSASKDPAKQRTIVSMGTLFYGLGTISLILAFIRLGSFPLFWWLMTAITFVMFVLFILSRAPKSTA